MRCNRLAQQFGELTELEYRGERVVIEIAFGHCPELDQLGVVRTQESEVAGWRFHLACSSEDNPMTRKS
jgi:hypothetical protein